MQIIILGDLKYFTRVTDKIYVAARKIITEFKADNWDFDMVFIWKEEEGLDIYWDVFDDVIQFGIPLSGGLDVDSEILEDKIRRAISMKIIKMKLASKANR